MAVIRDSCVPLLRSFNWKTIVLGLCFVLFMFRLSFPRRPVARMSIHPTTIPVTPQDFGYKQKIATSEIAQKAGFQGVSLNMILDESGSMGPVAEATRENFNKYINGQKKSCAELQSFGCTVSVTKFSYPEIIPLFNRIPIAETPVLTISNYRPLGGTNLLDTIGDMISRIDDTLSKMPDNAETRPSILVVIFTDGEENSSKVYDSAKIRKMISTRQELGWTFVFLGANIDAWTTAESYGIPSTNAYNFQVTQQDTLFDSLSSSSSGYAREQSGKLQRLKKGLESAASLFKSAASSSFFNKEERAKEYRGYGYGR